MVDNHLLSGVILQKGACFNLIFVGGNVFNLKIGEEWFPIWWA